VSPEKAAPVGGHSLGEWVGFHLVERHVGEQRQPRELRHLRRHFGAGESDVAAAAGWTRVSGAQPEGGHDLRVIQPLDRLRRARQALEIVS
jgi:hypothetical protein